MAPNRTTVTPMLALAKYQVFWAERSVIESQGLCLVCDEGVSETPQATR
jgi:hypothetical protein